MFWLSDSLHVCGLVLCLSAIALPVCMQLAAVWLAVTLPAGGSVQPRRLCVLVLSCICAERCTYAELSISARLCPLL